MLEKLWHRNLKVLRSIVRNVVPWASSVEDVLQDAFMRVMLCRRHFENEREAYSYLRRVVLNTAIDQYRQLQRHRRRFETGLDMASLPVDADPQVHDCADPLSRLIGEKRQEIRHAILPEVESAMKELSPEQRQAMELVFNRRHKKIKEICLEYGIPYSTLRSRTMAGIDRIRRKLRQKGVFKSYEEVNS